MSDTFNESAPTLKFGTVSAVDAETCRVRVRLPDLDNLRTAWLPVGVTGTRTMRAKPRAPRVASPSRGGQSAMDQVGSRSTKAS